MTDRPSDREIFLKAIDLTGDARRAFLDEACGDDVELRHRVERLLEVDARSSEASTTPYASEPSTTPVQHSSDDSTSLRDAIGLRPGDVVDGFKILETLGEGGMGVVYLAEQQFPVKRRIALKVIKPGMDSKQVLARFEAERQALAMMDHPGIARVLQAGTTDRGLPFFAMEYVKGEPITTAADRGMLDTTQRLRLMIGVCEAVQHAHHKGIIHRDLKPSNILVTTDSNDRPIVKIIDFGVAKATNQSLTEHTVYTQVGHFIGTPAYMSPEQADLTVADIDTRTDVYSLGVILYELLTGQLPFDPKELREAGLEEMRRRIREDDPPKPSTRLTKIDEATATRLSKARRTRIDQLQKSLASELDWIPLKALRKLRSERYSTPTDMAQDIQRYLDGEPLEAGPESANYRLKKFIKKRRVPIAVGGAFAVILMTATVVSGWFAAQAAMAQKEALRARDAAIQEKKEADVARSLAETRRDEAHAARSRTEDLVTMVSVSKALDAAGKGDVATVQRELAIVEQLGRGNRFDADFARAMADQSMAKLHAHESDGRVWSVAFSPDGAVLASAGDDMAIRLWDVSTCQPIGEPLYGHEGGVGYVSFSPDGSVLATGGSDATIRLWNASTGQEIGEPFIGHQASVDGVAFSPDGAELASVDADGIVRLWDASTGQSIFQRQYLPPDDRYRSLISFSQGGELSLCRPVGPSLYFRDVFALADRTLCELGKMRHQGFVESIAISPDGGVLASGGSDRMIRLWDASNCSPIGLPLRGHKGRVTSVAFSPDGALLASGGSDATIRLWDVATGKQIGEPLRGHGLMIDCIAFSPDGAVLASGSSGSLIHLWDISFIQQSCETLRGHSSGIKCIAFSPKGGILASGGLRTIRLWDALTGQPIGEPLRGHEVEVCSVAFSPDGAELASVDADGIVRLWDASTGQQIGEPMCGHEGDGRVSSVAFSPDGTVLASGGSDRAIRLWDVSTGQPMGEPLRGHVGHDPRIVRFSPKVAVLASGGGGDNTILLWNILTGQPIGEPMLGDWDSSVTSVAFSPDGTLLASGGFDATIRLWDVATGKQIGEPLRGHGRMIDCIAFSPDGAVLASGGLDSTIRLWDVATREPVGEPLRGHEERVTSVAFSPEGAVLASGSSDRTIRLWHAIPLRDRIGAIRARRAELDEMENAQTTDPPAEADGS